MNLQFITSVFIENKREVESTLSEEAHLQSIPKGDIFVFNNGTQRNDPGFVCVVMDLETLKNAPESEIPHEQRDLAIAQYKRCLAEIITREDLEAFGLPDREAMTRAIVNGDLITEQGDGYSRIFRKPTFDELSARATKETNDPFKILGRMAATSPEMAA